MFFQSCCSVCQSQSVATVQQLSTSVKTGPSSERQRSDVYGDGCHEKKDAGAGTTVPSNANAGIDLKEGRPKLSKEDRHSRSKGSYDDTQKESAPTHVRCSQICESSSHEVCAHFPFKGYVDRAECRGIKLGQLELALKYAIDNCHKWNEVLPDSSPARMNTLQPVSMNSLSMCTFNEWVVMPATRRADCSFVELLTDIEQCPQWFVSYWEGDRMRAFFRCITQHMKVRALPKETSHWWVCAYAVRQHSKSSDDILNYEQSSSFKAMSQGQGILLVLDGRLETSGPATPLKRLWNVFEVSFSLPLRTKKQETSLVLDIATAFKGDVHFITDGPVEIDRQRGPEFAVQEKSAREAQFPVDVLNEGFTFQLQEADASHAGHRQHILNFLLGRDPELPILDDSKVYMEINSMMQGIFAVAAWRQAIEAQCVDEWNLVRLVSGDLTRKVFVLDLSFCVQLNREDIRTLVESFPTSLEKLHLGFRSCSMFDDACLVVLASKLPQSLRELRLSVQGCKKVLSDGVVTLAAALPAELRILDLCFQYCEKVGELAVAAFVKKLGAHLQKLVLDFRGTVANVFLNSVEELRAWVPTAAPGQPKDGSQLRPGLAVRVHGLQQSKDVNGQQGIVERWDFMAERWVVCMRSGSQKSFKADNLQSASLDLQPGLDVVIYGMVVALELEGQRAKCSHWDASAARWHVRLTSGEMKAIKPENLKAA